MAGLIPGCEQAPLGGQPDSLLRQSSNRMIESARSDPGGFFLPLERKGSFYDIFVGEGLAPPGHFVLQNDIAAGDISLFPFGKSPIASQFGREGQAPPLRKDTTVYLSKFPLPFWEKLVYTISWQSFFYEIFQGDYHENPL